MCKTTNILSELQGKKVKINNRTQIITIEFNAILIYIIFKQNITTLVINQKDKTYGHCC